MPPNPSQGQTPPQAGAPGHTLSDANLPHQTESPPAMGDRADHGIILAAGSRPLTEYELIRLLGRGGFGEVWQARGPGGFDVALKFIRLGDRVGEVEIRSLELMKGIRHAHLLSMFGAWHLGGFLVIAMELADRTLLDRLGEVWQQEQEGIPRDELIEYMREAAKGLDYLNQYQPPAGPDRMVGIQHKDVKPQNLLLVGGCVKVADFGLAKVLEHTATTMSGGMTPAYAAPEFFNGQATRWSDQYCLAVSYCQLRGGRLPFGGNQFQMMAGHATQPPDLTMLPEVERSAVERALAKKPEDRWPNCRAFVAALASAEEQRQRDDQERERVRLQQEREALAATEEQRLTNSLGMKFAWIPPGTFLMGSLTNEEKRDDDETQHRVTLTRGFWLGVTPVTQAQWQAVMGKNPSHFKGDDRPVDSVSWEDCQEFCKHLTQKDSKRYRLPTEAEWEYACRAGTTTAFSFGDTVSTDQANYDGNYTYGKGKKGVYREKTTPVESFPANAWGLYDMHGNVFEWCQDWYGPYSKDDIKDPQGIKYGEARVLRGGCWRNYPGRCRAANRRRSAPAYRNYLYGCRVALCLD
jgi:formylglycine-generating enzyme required for sulfatase activity